MNKAITHPHLITIPIPANPWMAFAKPVANDGQRGIFLEPGEFQPGTEWSIGDSNS